MAPWLYIPSGKKGPKGPILQSDRRPVRHLVCTLTLDAAWPALFLVASLNIMLAHDCICIPKGAVAVACTAKQRGSNKMAAIKLSGAMF